MNPQFDLERGSKRTAAEYPNELNEAFLEVKKLYQLEQTYHEQRNEFEERYKEAKAIERTNNHGIMEGSYLTVRIIEARNLKPMKEYNSSDPYVVISIEGQKEETKFMESTINPKWDETFKFDIRTGKEPLEVLVLDRDLYSADDFEGKLSLNLMEFKDQMKVDKWYDLQSTHAHELCQGEIRVEIQWIHSRKKFFEDLLYRLDQIEKENKTKRKEMERSLREQGTPFEYYEYLDEGSNQGDNADRAKHVATGDFQAKAFYFEKRVSRMLDEVAEGLGFRNPPWYNWFYWLTLLYVFLTLCTCFAIPNFIDLTFSSL